MRRWFGYACLPGTKVTPDTILMDLVDPELQQKLLDAQLQLKAAQSDYKSLQATLQSTLMDKKAAAAAVNSAYTQDQLQAKTDKQLYDLGVISGTHLQRVQKHGRPVDHPTEDQPGTDRCEHVGDRGPAGLAADQDRSGQGVARSLREAGAGASGAGRHLRRAGHARDPDCRWASTCYGGTSVAEVVQLDKLKADAEHRRDPGARYSARPAGGGRHPQRHRSRPREQNRSHSIERNARG